jgi:hypothetical protein
LKSLCQNAGKIQSGITTPRRHSKHVPEKSCPLPLSPAERREKMAAWLAGMPQDVRAKAGKLKVAAFILGMGPGCAAIFRKTCRKPGLAFRNALYRLAGRADMFRRGTLILSDGSRLDFEPLRFLSYIPALATTQTTTNGDES